jgi:chromate reductase, NAD(P)H dehydrogenase (quinone)
MIILAISGSGRAGSTNTAMLNTVAKIARPNHDVIVFSGIAKLPVFSPDLELGPLPLRVQRFADMISASDAVIISSPEYVRSIPGGLKNAIDWLVSREEIIDKPIALMHASHGGHDMLDHLRLVLSTVSQKFSQDLFLHFQLRKLSQEEISQRLAEPENQQMILNFLQSLTEKHAL